MMKQITEVQQLRNCAVWNGDRGTFFYHKYEAENNHERREGYLKDAVRHFRNHDRLMRRVFLLEHSRKKRVH